MPNVYKQKDADKIQVTLASTPLIKQQFVVYEFKCDLCDADYVGYTGHTFF